MEGVKNKVSKPFFFNYYYFVVVVVWENVTSSDGAIKSKLLAEGAHLTIVFFCLFVFLQLKSSSLTDRMSSKKMERYHLSHARLVS